ncbi:hypothetical protein Q9Q94_11130 [Uliginosibacterium sp. 31-16]|uniref:hypothetical protein n=1 Tax=Uliginosibacterium sp. 31-16 TaxID=3068315 RepID=UPI00273D5A42|nr:hypothetical protein [Uliginosibacterium sp. 31-16]MDP5240087.1 hypothetical protein [Uliginosibacterium sp. 31-16]
MNAPLAIRRCGLVTSVGLTAASSCAAMRAKLKNATETGVMGTGPEWIMGHQVALDQPWRGLIKLARMAAMSIREALAGIPAEHWIEIPLLLCVAERERPGRLDGLETELLSQIELELGARFAPHSAVVPHGRVAVAAALHQARQFLAAQQAAQVLIVAADSLLTAATLSAFDTQERLLNNRNSNGFMPGEAAGAILVGPASRGPELRCQGIGFDLESAHITSEEPLRGDGLARACKAALAEAGCAMHEMDYRIADLSGEHYYFKEAALAVSRTMRTLKEEFDLWHPAEAIGETGAASGIAVIALADAASRKAYAPGPASLAHFANDAGQRAALVLHFKEA